MLAELCVWLVLAEVLLVLFGSHAMLHIMPGVCYHPLPMVVW